MKETIFKINYETKFENLPSWYQNKIFIYIILILEWHLAYKICTNFKNPNIKLLDVMSNTGGTRKRGGGNYKGIE